MRTVTHIKTGDGTDFGYDDFDILVHGVINAGSGWAALSFVVPDGPVAGVGVSWTQQADLATTEIPPSSSVMFETPIKCKGFNLASGGGGHATKILYSLLHR